MLPMNFIDGGMIAMISIVASGFALLGGMYLAGVPAVALGY